MNKQVLEETIKNLKERCKKSDRKPWMYKDITIKQSNLLNQFGVSNLQGLDRGSAKTLISLLIRDDIIQSENYFGTAPDMRCDD